MMKNEFDCVKMKHKMQEKLYAELKPRSIQDYFSKIIDYSQHSKLLAELIAVRSNTKKMFKKGRFKI
jgi:hypothetical protein